MADVLNNSQRKYENDISTRSTKKTSGVSTTSGRSSRSAARGSRKSRVNFKSTSSSVSSTKKGRNNKNSRTSKSRTNPSSSSSTRSPDTIKIICNSDTYNVPTSAFIACSNLIKKQRAENAILRTICLSKYDKVTAKVLVDFINRNTVKTDISFYSLAELLKLSKVFEMADLRNQLEKFVTNIAKKDLGALIQVLLIIGLTPVKPETNGEILAEAAKKFSELAVSPAFQQIQFNVMLALFARCDLSVKSEVHLVDAMLLWLAGQPHQSTAVPAMFYLVRTDFIHPIHRAFILERARALRMSDDVVSAISRCFNCTNGKRICILDEHIKAHYPRCGLPADIVTKDAKEPEMTLSVPRDAIIYKKPLSPVPQSSMRSAGYPPDARPFYHAPPACSNKSQKLSRFSKSRGARGKTNGKKRSMSSRGGRSGRGKRSTVIRHSQ